MTFGSDIKPRQPMRNFLMDSVLGIGMFVIFVMGVYLPGPLHHLIEAASLVVRGTVS